MAEYEVDFGFGMTQKFGKRSPAPGSPADAMPGMSSPAASPMTATTGGSPAPSGYISDTTDPDRYRKMADSLRQDWLSRTAPTGSVNGGMALGGSGRLPSPVPTVNSYGNDLSAANRFSAMADSMKQERLAYSAPPSGSLAGSMAMGDTGQLPALGSSPTTTISPPAVTNSFGNDMAEANRMNAGANVMKRSRLGTPAPGSLAGSLAGNLALNRPTDTATERTDNRTWGDLNQMPAFRQVENVGAMGGNF